MSHRSQIFMKNHNIRYYNFILNIKKKHNTLVYPYRINIFYLNEKYKYTFS